MLKYLMGRVREEPPNIALRRYFDRRVSAAAGDWKGVSTKLGKEFFQPVIEKLAGDVWGQQVTTGSETIDIVLERGYENEWFDRVCLDHGIENTPSRVGGNDSRIYLVQLKTDQASASGGSKPKAVSAMMSQISRMRKENRPDVVGVFYNVFGSIAKSRHSRGSKNYPCFELSGRIGFDWLVGDPTGEQFKIFCRALQETPVNPELAALLCELGYLHG